jgi:hypothetical protein
MELKMNEKNMMRLKGYSFIMIIICTISILYYFIFGRFALIFTIIIGVIIFWTFFRHTEIDLERRFDGA